VTVIAGVVDGGRVWMGGDSAFSNMATHEIIACSNQKVFKVGAFLVGVCGSARVADVLRYSFTAPKHARRLEVGRYMRTVFLDAAREAFRRSGLYQKDEPEKIDAQVLLGYRGRLFVLEEDLHIHEAIDDFAAIGSGGQVASGAMAVTRSAAPRKRILSAMQAAERYTASVRRPFYVLELA
jgi:ATP-dependent protease HslVU (ClpYQ) peptidase subunit